jgi:predicted phosphate transport protein (TIGR00153 family)
MRLFLPKQPVFFDLLQELNHYLKDLASLFCEFAVSFSDFERFSKEAKEIEHKGDTKLHEIIDQLNTTFITPIDREDIYLLAQEIDDIIDLIENAIRNVEFYQIREKKEFVVDFARLIVAAQAGLDELIACLPNPKNTAHFESLVIKIHGLEDEGDVLFQKNIRSLFKEEPDPINVIKWKDILEGLEEIMDKYQKVSDIVRGIVVKFS